MKILKKILAFVLAANLLCSAVLAVSANEPADNPEIKDSSISDLMNSGSTNPLTGNETLPFNSAPGASILMNKENELLLYTSNKYNKDKNDDFITVFEQMDQNKSYVGEGSINPSLDLFFVTAVALNASGNGTDDHIAYLGVKAFDKNDVDYDDRMRAGEQVLMLVLYNARKDRVVAKIEIGSVKSWASYVEQYAYKTLFSITAGDYDGDGVDEIACTDEDMGVAVFRVHTDDDGDMSLRIAKRYYWTDLVDKDIAEKMKKSVTSHAQVCRRAFISLATGNFDGTGAEELATAVSTNDPDDDDFYPDIPEAYTTQVALLKNPLSNSAEIKTLAVQSKEDSKDEEEQDNVVYRTIYLGQITAGDVDGDRRDELVVAGYTGEIEVTNKGKIVDGEYEYDTENIALCYVKQEEGWFGVFSMTVDAMTPFIEEGFFDSSETLVPLSIDAAKLHGQYGKESVFVGGKVYQFSDESATALYTHPFFENESSYRITDAYVEHVISGVFGGPDPLNDGKPMINEQFVFTVVEKDNSQNEYNYQVGFISLSTNQQTEASSFFDNSATMNKDGYLLEELYGGMPGLSGALYDTNYGTAFVPIAADIDDDGMLVKHTNTTYFYEDPSVEAILQAAPYFEELGDWNQFNSSTTYSISVSRSLIDIWGYTHSIHGGFKGKIDFGNVSEIELKVGYALDMDFEHEKSYTKTYTTTFEAGSFDTVVVQRTPYVCYEYSFVDIHGNLLTGDDAGSVVFMEAMQPVYFQLSVDEYNQFVDEYNAIAERHDREGKTADGEAVETVGDSYRLIKITDDILPSNATGNPENYFSVVRDGEYISQSTYALSTNGGYTSSEFSYEIEETYSAVYAHGMHFELEGVGGTKSLGAGAFVALSFQETCGYGDATINGTGTGASVANIIPSNYSEKEQATLKLYGFNWRCALWKKSLMTDANNNPYRDSNGNIIQVPIVGYVVTNVKRPMAAPSGVDAYLCGDGYQVRVDWKPFTESAVPLLGYYIYRTCDNQDPVQVNSTLLPATACSFVDTSILKPGKIYNYHVTACYDNGGAKYLTMNSNTSTVVWGIPQLPEDFTQAISGDNTNNGDNLVASVFGGNSFSMVFAMISLGVSVSAIGIIVYSKKKKSFAENGTEE